MNPTKLPSLNFYKCSKCGCEESEVVQTCLQHDGQRVRRRRCKSCEMTWYTLQPPEEKIDGNGFFWGAGVVIGLSGRLKRAKKIENIAN